MNDTVKEKLAFVYGAERAAALAERVTTLVAMYRPAIDVPAGVRARRMTAADAILITYGDQVQAPSEAPLAVLRAFARDHLRGVVNTIHLLPFYPYSSDDGFSVIDYKAVDPELGTWSDVVELGQDFQLMFDAVVNHISVQSAWFQAFKRDEAPYRDFFTVVAPDTDLSATFRPRALPLLTAVDTVAGTRHVWTTFSDDQVDLNYANPDVLLAVLDVLLFYASQGARFIRLDAIAFMWKEIGTSSIHRPQTHALIQLMRAVLDAVAPHVALITETNVPHQENISYFGDGRNEAQLVYNFSLPPLTLHAFHTGEAEVLSRWADTLALPSDGVTFFNFLASHDGIGLTPARGLLPEAAVLAMAERVRALGGYVSVKANADGSESPYELNINYLDALGDPDRPDEAEERVAARFLAAQAIMLALRGVPGIYFHSLVGSRGWPAGVAQTGRYRTVNREKLQQADLEAELAGSGLRHLVFDGYRRLLAARAAAPAFDPHGEQHIHTLHPAVFAVERRAAAGAPVLCLHNVRGEPVTFNCVWRDGGDRWVALTGRRAFTPGPDQAASVALRPYEVLWLAGGA